MHFSPTCATGWSLARRWITEDAQGKWTVHRLWAHTSGLKVIQSKPL